MIGLLMALAMAAEVDPFGGPPAGEAAAIIRQARFGEPGADAAIAAWLRQHPAASVAERARLAHRLCGDLRARNANAAAADPCALAAALGADDGQAAAISEALSAVPPISAIGSARAPLTPNALGSRDVTVSVNGVAAPWLVDTGAQITTVSESLAQRIGLRALPAPLTVRGATGFARGKLAIIDRLTIGAAEVRHAPVLILPDASLEIGGLPRIEAILGLPVLVAFGRAAWLDGGKTLALGEAAPPVPADAPRLYWHEEGIGVPVSTPLGVRGAQLDTGANTTYLRPAARALLDPATQASAFSRRGKVGGAGGVIETPEIVYPRLALEVLGARVVLRDVPLVDEPGEGAARLGEDVAGGFATLILDFETMRALAGPISAGPAPGAGRP